MAIRTGPKLVKDLPERDRVAIGITLPLQKGNGGYFAQSYQTSEQVKSNIKNLILTRKGERLMHPTFGTDLCLIGLPIFHQLIYTASILE